MLHVKASAQNKPTQVTNSETAFLSSWRLGLQTHSSTQLKPYSRVSCGIKQEQRQKRRERYRPTHHFILLFCSRSFFLFAFWTALLLDFLLYLAQILYKVSLSRVSMDPVSEGIHDVGWDQPEQRMWVSTQVLYLFISGVIHRWSWEKKEFLS